MNGVLILIMGLGCYVLECVFMNEEFLMFVDMNDEWIIECIGICEWRIV